MRAMKQPTKIALIHNKVQQFVNKIFFTLLKLRGMQSGKGTRIGSIRCNWPNKIILGSYCEIQDDVDFRLWQPFNDSSYIEMGENVFIGHACEFVCNTKITIGHNCLIASRCTLNDTGHEFNRNRIIKLQPITSKEIIIEDDVWIGTSCVILQGVTIGQGSVIAAGSVVNKSIPPYEVWAGVPARFIKKRE
jgi:acetyltransferase-like isoleucine patch superfamily enzyme